MNTVVPAYFKSQKSRTLRCGHLLGGGAPPHAMGSESMNEHRATRKTWNCYYNFHRIILGNVVTSHETQPEGRGKTRDRATCIIQSCIFLHTTFTEQCSFSNCDHFHFHLNLTKRNLRRIETVLESNRGGITLYPNTGKAPFTQDVQREQMGPVVVNGSVHTACKQHQKKNVPICVCVAWRVLCELGLTKNAFYWSPLEMTLLSLMCYSACLIHNWGHPHIFTRFCLFRFSKTHLYIRDEVSCSGSNTWHFKYCPEQNKGPYHRAKGFGLG